MNLSLFENASALRGLEQYQNVIANNIAASHVAGFKKVAVSFEAVEGGEIARSTHDRLRNEMPGSFPVMKNQVDYNEGEMKETHNPSDLALRGEGFFGLLNQNGDVVRLKDFENNSPLVIYFYPKDETPGCTAEACSFRDSYDAFEEAGAKIFGISGDSVKSHAKFAKRLNLNFTLLSDPKRIAEKKFGVERNLFGLLPGRETFVFNRQGRLTFRFNSALKATQHVKMPCVRPNETLLAQSHIRFIIQSQNC